MKMSIFIKFGDKVYDYTTKTLRNCTEEEASVKGSDVPIKEFSEDDEGMIFVINYFKSLNKENYTDIIKGLSELIFSDNKVLCRFENNRSSCSKTVLVNILNDILGVNYFGVIPIFPEDINGDIVYGDFLQSINKKVYFLAEGVNTVANTLFNSIELFKENGKVDLTRLPSQEPIILPLKTRFVSNPQRENEQQKDPKMLEKLCVYKEQFLYTLYKHKP